MPAAIRLRDQSLKIDAPRGLVFEVVAAGGDVVERLSSTQLVVDFTSKFRKRKLVTRELVTLQPPFRIFYEWLDGPLPCVEEQIEFSELNAWSTHLRYTGDFEGANGLLAQVVNRIWIRPIFNRLVHRHLVEAKLIAERRAARSHVWKVRAEGAS